MQVLREKSTAEKIVFSVSLILCILSLISFVFSFFHLRLVLRYESLLIFMLSAVICVELYLIIDPRLTCIISVWIYVLLSFVLRETEILPLFRSPVIYPISGFLFIALAFAAAFELKHSKKRNSQNEHTPYIDS